MSISRRRVNIRMVASAAGVSTASVSKALNNKPDISASLREKIFAVCDDLGYQVNSSIQDLVRLSRSGETRNIAFILVRAEFADPVYARAIDGIAEASQKFGLHLILDHLRGDEKSIYDLPPILRDGRIDGFVLTGDINPNIMTLLKKLKVPYVILGSYSSEIIQSSVNVLPDTKDSIAQVISRLKSEGKKRIAYFTEDFDNYFQQECLRFFKLALEENDLPLHDDLIYFEKSPFAGAFKTFEKVFKQDTLPFDSIVALDFRAAQEISYLVMAYYGIGVKPEITIATSPPFDYFKLPVPAVYLEGALDQTAYEAMEILYDIINGKKENNSMQILLKQEIKNSD